MRSFFSSPSKKAKTRRTASLEKKHRTTLAVESLEDRLVPTVVFTPNFGPEKITNPAGPAGTPWGSLRNPTIVPIFWGSYWSTAAGKQDIQSTYTAMQSIVSGQYLSGLAQYGSDGHATMNSTYAYDYSTPVSWGIETLVQGTVDQGYAPAPLANGTAKIYVVITDPNAPALQAGAGGYNTVGLYTYYASSPHSLNDPNNQYIQDHLVWVSTSLSGSNISLNTFTTFFSHELVETITDPYLVGLHVSGGTTYPSSLLGKGVLQIADNEPNAGNYTGFVGGYQVQAYWSDNDKAFIVPDGNRQRFTLTPLWSGSSFTGAFDLAVQGDQLGANHNDSIKINGSNSSTTVTMNGESATFAGGSLKSINVDTGGGINNVNVTGLSGNDLNVPGRPSGLTLNIGSTGAGNDAVLIGGNGTLSSFTGYPAINVSNASGRTALTINASNDGPGYYGISNNAIATNNVTVNYTGGTRWSDGSIHQVTYIDVFDGHGPNMIAGADTNPFAQVYFYGAMSDMDAAAGYVWFMRTHS